MKLDMYVFDVLHLIKKFSNHVLYQLFLPLIETFANTMLMTVFQPILFDVQSCLISYEQKQQKQLRDQLLSQTSRSSMKLTIRHFIVNHKGPLLNWYCMWQTTQPHKKVRVVEKENDDSLFDVFISSDLVWMSSR